MRRLSSGIISCAICFVAIVLIATNFTYGQSSPHGAIKIPCINCHTTESWKELARPMKFNHTTTGFSLQGAHSNVQCVQCHITKRFTGTTTDCFQCHAGDFTKALSPNHQLGKFSHDCLSCHTMNGWKPSVFLHSKTNFQLLGSHLSVDCASCHTNNHFAGLAHDCYSCHQKDFIQTTTPNHKTGRFSHDCLTCHAMAGWKPATFDHNKTNFRLANAHAGVECSSCHIGGKFKALPTDCYSCHNLDFNKTTQPNHTTAKFSHDCLSCHTDVSWKPSVFDHNKTKLPLTGAHATAECNSCHATTKFVGLPTDCYTCHTQDIVSIKTIDHSKLAHDCLTCHTTIVWKPSTFDHNKSKLPLVGAHATAECNSCHLTTKFTGLPTDCYTCHTQDYVNAKTLNHSQFSHDCLTCHSSIAWKPSTFNHSATAFPLVGAHTTVACSSCHTNGVFKGLPSDCFSCHQTNFNNTTTPNHATAQFSHDCLTCHSTIAWKPSTFNHANTNFPLLGAHAAVVCGDCHKNGVFKGLTADCYTCHTQDFVNAKTLNHSGLTHDCSTCHTPIGWKQFTYDHNVTAFKLVGAHASATCASCHTSGVFKGLTTDCYTCHQADYNGTTNPNHVQGQYNTAKTCISCHNTVAWQPWIFVHSVYSPYATGKHSGNKCNQCHFTAGTFTTYNCTTGCHSGAHNKTKSCVSSGCHPNRDSNNY